MPRPGFAGRIGGDGCSRSGAARHGRADTGRATAQPPQAAQPSPAQAIDLTVGAQQQIAIGHILQRVAIGDPSVADVLIIKGDKRGGVLLVGKAAGHHEPDAVGARSRYAAAVHGQRHHAGGRASLLGADTPGVKVLGSTALVSGTSATMEAHQRAVVAARRRARQGRRGIRHVDGREPRGRAGRCAGGRVQPFGAQGSGLQLLQAEQRLHVRLVRAVGVDARYRRRRDQAPQYDRRRRRSSSAFNLIFNSATRGLFANLSLLESNNLARVLAEPTLVALSGQSASFLAGGEMPMPVPQALGTTSIEYKPYGVGLTLTPTVLEPAAHRAESRAGGEPARLRATR